MARDNWEFCIGKAALQEVFICLTNACGHKLFGEEKVDVLASVLLSLWKQLSQGCYDVSQCWHSVAAH